MTLALWKGEFGDSYVDRNQPRVPDLRAREALWKQILNTMLPARPQSILEVGSNVGNNLVAMYGLLPRSRYFAIEPNDKARCQLVESGIVDPLDAYSGMGDLVGTVDLIFTSGVLIHIPPDMLREFCQKIYDHSSRWIVAIEYFSHEPQEVKYRGEMGRLWKRDWGSFYLQHFPDLHPIACGFAWKPLTGLDDLTWVVLEKR